MLGKKQLVVTIMTTGMLVPIFVSTVGVFADVTIPKDSLIEVAQKEKRTIPYITLNSDSFGETITALTVENNILSGTRTKDHVEESGYEVGYGVYSSNSPEFNLQTATEVGFLDVDMDDLSQLVGTYANISSFPVAKYYYIVTATINSIPLVRINGEDLLGNASF